jgi:hypothetical protein
MKTQRGTIKEMAVRSLVQSHPRHQIRFNNPARRSDTPTGITETKRKIVRNQQPQNETKQEKTRIHVQRKYSQVKILPVQRNKLFYNMLTEKRHQQITG